MNRDRTGGSSSQIDADAGPCAKRPRHEENEGSNGNQPAATLDELLSALDELLSAADTASVQGPGKCPETGTAVMPLEPTRATALDAAAPADSPPIITSMHFLAQPNTTALLQKVVESSWTGDKSDLEAAAAATVPHLLAVPAVVARLTLRIPDFQNKVPYVQILQDAATAYTVDPGPGFCKHVQQAARAAGRWVPDGATGDGKDISFDPCQPLSIAGAVEVLATLPRPVRARISRWYNRKQGDSIPAIKGRAYKRVLWAVYYIPPCHDNVIKMMMHRSARAPVISDVGMDMLRRLAALYIADPGAYAGDEAVISVEAT